MKHHLLSITLIAFLSATINAQEWTSIAPMPAGKHHPVTFSLNGFGYAFTGWDFQIGPDDNAFKYDPKADEWTSISDFPGTDRSFAIGYTYDGKGYLGFGANTFQYLGDIWEFDPTSEQWTQLTTCPCEPRRHPAFVIVDGIIYTGMGDGSTGNYNDFWKYDIAADEWTQLNNLPGPVRHHPFQFVVDSTIYAGFGHAGANIWKDWYRFDPETEEWEKMNDLPGEARVAGTQFSHGGWGYVLSGDGDNHSFMEEGEFWQYTAEDDEWKQMPSHPGISLWAPGSFVIEDTVYFMGGENRQTSNIQADAWKFPLPTPEPTTPPAAIEDLSTENSIVVYPNPASDLLNLKSENLITKLEVYSISGQLIRSETRPNAQIDVSGMPNGYYLLKLEDETGNKQLVKFSKI